MQLAPLARFVACSTCAALPLAAQVDDAHVLIRVGEVLPGGETVLGFTEHRILDDGRWAAIVRIAGPAVLGGTREALVLDGAVVIAESLPLPTGEVVEAIDELDLLGTGTPTVVVSMRPPGAIYSEQAVWSPGGFVLREGPIAGPGLAAGTALTQIFDFELTQGFAAVAGRLSIAGAPEALLRFDLSGGVGAAVVSVVAVGGQPMAPFTSPFLSTYPGNGTSVDAAGAVGALTIVDDAGTSRFAAAANGVSYYLTGGPAPLAGWDWLDFGVPPVFVCAPNGVAAVSGTIREAATNTNRGLVTKGGAVFAVSQGPVPGMPGLTLGPFSEQPLALSDAGELFVVLPVAPSGSNAGGDVLMVDQEVLLRAGESTISGRVLEGLSFSFTDELDASPDGNRCVFAARLSGNVEALCTLQRAVGEAPACVSAPNSTGVRGRLSGAGSDRVAVNDLVVTARLLPSQSFGYLNASRTAGFVAQPGGSVGNLCLGGAIGRYVSQVQSSGAQGRIATTIDLSTMPQPSGSVAALPGETWSFQLWHRDAGPTGPVSNWTNPLLVRLR